MIELSNISVTETASVTEPVSLDELKDWIEVDFPDKDDLILAMGVGARQSIEQYLNWSLVEKDVTLDMENRSLYYSSSPFPYARAATTVVVNERDDEDTETLLTAADDYFLRDGSIRLGTGRFSVAYTTVPGDIPEAIKEAIKMEVAERWVQRGENNNLSRGLSEAAKAKCAPYRIEWL